MAMTSCTKCGSRKIMRMAESEKRACYPVEVDTPDVGTIVMETFFFYCADCGYVERWVNPEHLPAVTKLTRYEGYEWVNPPPEGPYR